MNEILNTSLFVIMVYRHENKIRKRPHYRTEAVLDGFQRVKLLHLFRASSLTKPSLFKSTFTISFLVFLPRSIIFAPSTYNSLPKPIEISKLCLKPDLK